MKNLWAPWRMTYILGEDEAARNQSCIFCVNPSKAGPDRERLILFVGRLCMVMMNRYPYNNMHLLVAPRRHAAEPGALTRDEMADLMVKVERSIDILRRHSKPDGFNVGLNLGRVAGAGVEAHMHFHIVPRWNGDTNFMTVFDDVRVVPEHILATYDRLLPLYGALED
jgi:ATP adenylyltransferase